MISRADKIEVPRVQITRFLYEIKVLQCELERWETFFADLITGIEAFERLQIENLLLAFLADSKEGKSVADLLQQIPEAREIIGNLAGRRLVARSDGRRWKQCHSDAALWKITDAGRAYMENGKLQ